MWRCVKIGLVCCCLVEREGKKDVMNVCVCVLVGVVGGVLTGLLMRSGEVRCPVSGFRWYVPSGGLVWNLGVNDTTVLLVGGMVNNQDYQSTLYYIPDDHLQTLHTSHYSLHSVIKKVTPIFNGTQISSSLSKFNVQLFCMS